MRQFNLAYIYGDTATGVTAAGTTAATATTLTADHSYVETVTSSANGVIFKAGSAREIKTVFNADSADGLYVYPPSGSQFNGFTADFPVLIPYGHGAIFFYFSSTKIGVAAA